MNLQDGSLAWTIPSLPEAGMTALAISDSGKRIAFGIFDAANQRCGVRVYEIEGLKAKVLWQWRQDPPSHQITPAREAHWLAEDRLGILDDRCFAVWMPDTYTQHAVISADERSVTQLSPGGGQMAMFTLGHLILVQTDGVRQWGYSQRIPEGSHTISFHPQGVSILVSGREQAVLIDTTTGIQDTLDIPDLKNKKVQWVHGNVVLIDSQLVYDIENKRPIWTFQSDRRTKAAGTDVQANANKFLVVDRTHSRLLARDITDLIDEQKIAEGLPSEFAVDAGSTVQINILGNAVEPFRDEINAYVQNIVEKNGWKVAENSPTVMSVSLNEVTEALEFETTGILNAVKRTERISATFERYGICILHQNRVLFGRTLTSFASQIKSVPAGKTLQQVVNERSQFKPGFITAIEVPAQIKSKETFTGFGSTEIPKIK